MSSIEDFFVPTAKQKEAYKHIGKGGRIFYGGARGGGKSAFALWSAVVVALQFPFIKIVAIRETYPELEEVFISELQKKYPENAFGYVYRDKNKTATFSNGAKIIFRACDSPKAAKKIQGIEYQYMIIDEAPNFDVMTIHRLTGSLRSALKNKFVPSLLMTGNPGGISDPYFISRFVKPDYGKWEGYELKYKERYVFVPATVYDNKHVSKDYVEMLEGLPEHLRKAWLEGLWGIFEGQFFEDWNMNVHVIDPFPIPDNWVKKAGFDLGWTRQHPSVCLWVAQDPKSKDLFVFREYVNNATTEVYAEEIMALEKNDGYVETYADPSMFAKQKPQEAMSESDSQIFLRKGKYLMPAKNERVIGWRVVKQWLNYTPKKPPKLFVFNTCRKLIDTIPTLRYDRRARNQKEDLDTKQADDAADALRYVLLTGFTYPTKEELEQMELSEHVREAYAARAEQYKTWGIDNPLDEEGFLEKYEKADYS